MPKTAARLPMLLRWVGVLCVATAIGHSMGVAPLLAFGPRSYDRHAVYLIWVGALLLYTGCLDIAASHGLQRTQPWGRTAGIAAAFLALLFSVPLLPILLASAPPVFWGVPLGLVLVHAGALTALANGRGR